MTGRDLPFSSISIRRASACPVRDRPVDTLREDDLAGLGVALEAGGGVHDVAERGEVLHALGPDVADVEAAEVLETLRPFGRAAGDAQTEPVAIAALQLIEERGRNRPSLEQGFIEAVKEEMEVTAARLPGPEHGLVEYAAIEAHVRSDAGEVDG